MPADLSVHVQDIARALDGKVSQEEIAKELGSYLSVYRVSLETAKRSIVKKHGGDLQHLSVGVRKTLLELQPGEMSVDLLCRIVSLNPKEFEQDGKKREIFYGILGDESGTLPFTAWEPRNVRVEKGDVVRIQNAYTKEYRGQVQVNFGARTYLAKESPDSLPAYRSTETTAQRYKIGELKPGLGTIVTVGRILSTEVRKVEVEGTPKTVYSGILADETGKIPYSAWSEFPYKEGDVVKISGGYIRGWRGIPQLNFDERSKVEKLLDEAAPAAEELRTAPRVWIEDMATKGGAVGVAVRGIIVDVKPGSGLVYRCKDCRRVLKKGNCRIHGDVPGDADLRVKAILDDGSGALTVMLGRELTERLLGKTMDQCIEQARDAMDQEVVRDELGNLLIAQPVEAQGNVTSDEYGLMMIATEAQLLYVDVQSEARLLLEELEESEKP